MRTTTLKSSGKTTPVMSGAAIYTNDFLCKGRDRNVIHCCHLQVLLVTIVSNVTMDTALLRL